MLQSDYARAKWNKKHKERLADMSDPLPNERLKNLSPTVQGGTAIDLACGLGGNSLYLAEQGFVVEAVDISETAIEFVRELAVKRRLNINASVMDLTDSENLPFKNGAYDLIVIANYLDRSLFPYVKRLLKEGGHFFMETYYNSPNKEGGKVSERFRLKPNELLEQFWEWEVLFFEENEQEGRQIIFCRKPGLLE
ncbi:methyltransferase domain-containing protein [Neobacillus sp. YIM B06451]|uniref:class I SAM-dependent methyltransferase n=1 Tax=Neobacillus sp. YIM B06451 TaxID=3070994 RepID=UPI00292DF169|nr:methyltransferase domain-containing protein [Neobacillus sp. YIM B06451]